MRDRWMDDRASSPSRKQSPPPGHRWMANYTAQELATIQRLAWDGRQVTEDHYIRSNLIAGSVKAMAFHDLLDRRVEHTTGDRHGFCSSHNRAQENFEGLCSQRLGRSPLPQPCDEQTRRRIAEKRRADEEKVRDRFRERRQRQLAAEKQIILAPPPGSRLAKQRRELIEDVARPASARSSARSSAFAASRSASAPGLEAEGAWSRWQRQFGGGRAKTERLTGQYVHSLDDVGRVERVPAEHRTPGKMRLSKPKADAFFSSSLRGYSPSSTPRRNVQRSATGRGPRTSVTL